MAASLVGKGLGSNMSTSTGTTAAGDVLLFFTSQIWPGSGSFSIKDQIGGVDTGNTWTLLTDVYTPLYGYGVCAWKCTSGSRGANHRVVLTDDGRSGAVGFFVRVPNATDVDVFAANTTSSAVATGTLAQASEEVLLFGVDANPGGNPTWSTTLPSSSKVAEETNNSLYTCAVLYTSTVSSTASVSGNISPSSYPGKIILGVKLSAGGTTAALTGVAATGAVGTVSPATSKALTGNAATGAAGSVKASLSLPLTGNSATAAIGTVAPSLSKSLTGVQATGSAGTATPNITVALTGVQATGQVGTVAPSNDTFAPLSGVSATGSAGTVTPNVTVALTGVQASGQVGSVTPQSGATAALSGVQAAGNVGNVGVNVTVALTGVSATGQVGNVAFASRDVSVALTGVQAVGLAGTVTPVGGDAPLPPSGMAEIEVDVRKPRRYGRKAVKPLLQRVLDAKYPRVKPAKERAQRRAKAIEQDAAQLIADQPQNEARFNALMQQWHEERPVLPADVDPRVAFEAQVGFRLRQLELVQQARAAYERQRDDEDAIAVLLLLS